MNGEQNVHDSDHQNLISFCLNDTKYQKTQALYQIIIYFLFIFLQTLRVANVQAKKIDHQFSVAARTAKKSLHLASFSTFCRICIFYDKFHQQIDHLTCLNRNYIQEKCFTQVNSIDKRLIRRLCMKFLLRISSSFTKLSNLQIYSL